MINFKNIEKIVTHSGHAHRDDFLSVCFTLAMCKEENNLPILQRRDPTDADLNNPNVVVLDIGEQHNPQLSNFDHHQFDRDAEPCCALSLLLKDMTIYKEAHRGFRWLSVSEKFDSKGPYFVANEIGIDWSKISDATYSPIEEVILHQFSKFTELNSENSVYALMTEIGSSLIQNLEMFTQRWNLLETQTESTIINNNEIVLARGIPGDQDPTFALNSFVSEKYPNAIATVTNDDRGDGLCFYRLNDSNKIDFSKLENHKFVLFAHKNGFVAKTKTPLNLQEITELFNLSFA